MASSAAANCGTGRHRVAHRVHLAEQFAAGLLPVVGDAPGDDAFHLEPRRVRVAAGGKGLELRPQEALFGEPPLRLGQHHVGRNHALVAGALEQREHGPDARIGQPLAGRVPGLHQVGRRFVAVVAVGHAADQRVLVGLLGQFGKQLAELDAVHVGGDRLAELAHVLAARVRLRVPGVVVRHAAPQEDLDDRLGLGFGRRPAGLRRLAAAARASDAQAVGQHQPRRAAQAPPQRLAPGDPAVAV